MAPKNRGKNKNPPIFSHEFVIQNHADIVSCIAMVFVVGLMFQFSNPLSGVFIAMQHNVSSDIQGEGRDAVEVWYYSYGPCDMCAVFFYFLICIVMHAVVQEYILDKLNRKLHLSKVKNSKFNESGQLLAFYLVSVIWGAEIIYSENYTLNISLLWEGYPHTQMLFGYKLFYIIQMAYWLHNYPELYFQKIKREDMWSRVQYSTLYMAFIALAYLLNLSRVCLCLLVLHYVVEFIFHAARLSYFAEKTELANTCFMMWNVLFVIVRLGSITLAVLTFWYGLEKSAASALDISNGNFNIKLIRINCLLALILLQGWLMWQFITFHLKRVRDHPSSTSSTSSTSPPQGGRQGKLGKARARRGEDRARSGGKEEKGGDDDDVNDLPEADQGTARLRKATTTKKQAAAM